MKILFFANTDWYLYNFRLDYARHLRSLGHEVVMVSPPGEHGARITVEGFRWIRFDLNRRSTNPLLEIAVLQRLVRLYKREQPDVAHHFTIKCVVYGTLAGRAAGTRALVNSVAGLGYVFANGSPLALLLRPIVSRLVGFTCGGANVRTIVQNPDDMRFLAAMGTKVSRNLRLIVGSGVDLERFSPVHQAIGTDVASEHLGAGASPGVVSNGENAPASSLAPGELTVLFVGRLLHDKGIAEFVAAAAQIRQKVKLPVRFVAAGQADLGNPASIDALTLKRWKDAGTVRFLGHVEDMPALLASADIVVLPSYREGAPRSLIEAAACGKALLATDVPGCRDVVEHGVNGLLVPPRNAQELAAALKRLIEDAPMRMTMGRRSREVAIGKLSNEIVFRLTYDAYTELVDRLRSPEITGPLSDPLQPVH